MKKVTAILGLVLMSFTAQARSINGDAKDLAAQIISEINADKSDRAASKANSRNYYENKLSLCVFKKDLDNALTNTKAPIDLNECSGIISQALDRGDLDESGIRDVIDSLSKQRNTAEVESSIRAERQKQIQLRTKGLVEYGNQKLN